MGGCLRAGVCVPVYVQRPATEVRPVYVCVRARPCACVYSLLCVEWVGVCERVCVCLRENVHVQCL